MRIILNSNELLYLMQEPLEDASGDFTIKNDNGDYRDHGGNSIQVQQVLHTTKSELRERSSNTNAYVMLVDLEALFASQVRIMKYEYLDKFLSIKLKENIYLKSHLATMIGFMDASPTRSTK
jgi:hypothetical protein